MVAKWIKRLILTAAISSVVAYVWTYREQLLPSMFGDDELD